MTTSEIAKRLGLSRGTVSRVLNNNPNVNEKTRKLVLEAVEKWNYVPNEAARALVMKKTRKIAFIVFSEPFFFWEQVQHGINTAANELRATGLVVDYYPTNILYPQEQLDLLQKLSKEDYDAFIVAPNDPWLMIEEIDRISDSGRPVLIINVDIPTAKRICYVGSDYTESGQLAAEILAKSMQFSGNVAILTLKDQVVAIDQRVTGFRSEIAKYKNINITSIHRFNRLAEGVRDEVNRLLSSDLGITGIYVSFGALEQTAESVRRLGLCNKVSVVGYDLSEEIYSYLKQGAITATISQEPLDQGYFSIKILYNLLYKDIPPFSSILYNKLEVIFANNAKKYLNESAHLALFHL